MPVFKTAEDIAMACRKAGFYWKPSLYSEDYRYSKKLKNGKTLEARIYESDYNNCVKLQFVFPFMKHEGKVLPLGVTIEYKITDGFLIPVKAVVEKRTMPAEFSF